MYNNELYHHGVLGMKWGVRRYQPYGQGGYTPKEQKKNFKELKRVREVNSDPFDSNKEVKQFVNEKIKKVITNDDIKELKSINERLKDAVSNLTEDFFDSKQYEKLYQDSYKQTYDWFDKNRPDYLKEIIKNNGGSKDNLDDFHDFRKTFEGYLDVGWEKAENEWNKTEAGKNEAIWNKAYSDYETKCEEITNRILGEYGNQKLSENNFYNYSYVVKNNADINSIIESLKDKGVK